MFKGLEQISTKICIDSGKVIKSGFTKNRSLWIPFYNLKSGWYRLRVKAIGYGKESRSYSTVWFEVKKEERLPAEVSPESGSSTRYTSSSSSTRSSNSTRTTRPTRPTFFTFPLLDSTPILSNLLPDLSGFISKPRLSSSIFPLFATEPRTSFSLLQNYPLYVDTVNYWQNVGNRLSYIIGRNKTNWARLRMVNNFITNYNTIPYLYHLGSNIYRSPVLRKPDFIPRWTNYTINQINLNPSYNWQQTITNAITIW
jgi:hypothetical protein